MSADTQSDRNLKPGIGIGALRFGASREAVEAALGRPTAIEDEVIPSWVLWDYPELGYELAFDSEEDNRLVSLRCDDARLLISDQLVTSLGRDALLALGEKLGWGAVEIESGADGDEEIDYPDTGLMFSLRRRVVIAVSAAALVDDDDHYAWP